nr:tetratricopeptide repeat protein [Bacteroidota bacterium]
TRGLLFQLLRDYPENYLELAAYYMNSDFFSEAMALLEIADNSENEVLKNYPTVFYCLGYLHHLMNNHDQARHYFRKGMEKSTDYCFPFRLESLNVYKTALTYNNNEDSRAYYYMGNLLFDKQPEKAIQMWEKAVELEPGLAIAHRNLGWGYQYQLNDVDKAIASYKKAIMNDRTQSRYYFELDQLYERRGDSIEKRLKILTDNHKYVAQRQDALIREILVLVLAGEYGRAINLLDSRYFYRQEGSDELHDIHVNAHLLKGKLHLANGNPEAALNDFLLADTYPENQLIGRISTYPGNPQIYYYTGLAYEAKGDLAAAKDFYVKAYNQKNINREYLFYQAMAYQKSGNHKKANQIFEEMIDIGQKQLQSTAEVDFFAKFGSGLTENQRKANAYHIIGLGYMGKSETKKAQEFFTNSLELDVNQLWSRVYLEEL